MRVIVVRFVVKPEFAALFVARVLQQATDTLAAEPACRQFDVCVDPDDDHRVYLYEVYDDDEAFAVHLSTAHFAAFDRETRSWVERKDVERWSRLERSRSMTT